MKVTVTDTPATLGRLLHTVGYVPSIYSDAWSSVSIRNINYVFTAWAPNTYTFTVNPPVFVEWANLQKLNTVAVWSTDFITQDWDTPDPLGIGSWPNPKKYISEWEAYSILDWEVHNFVTFDLDRIHLRTCPGETVEIEVFIE